MLLVLPVFPIYKALIISQYLLWKCVAYFIKAAMSADRQAEYSSVRAYRNSLFSTASDQRFEAIPAASPTSLAAFIRNLRRGVTRQLLCAVDLVAWADDLVHGLARHYHCF